MSVGSLVKILKGGSGSGNFGHSGRPGKIGGSGGKGGAVMHVDEYNDKVASLAQQYGFTKNGSIDGYTSYKRSEYYGNARITPELVDGQATGQVKLTVQGKNAAGSYVPVIVSTLTMDTAFSYASSKLDEAKANYR